MNATKSSFVIPPIDFDKAQRDVQEFATERNIPVNHFPQTRSSMLAGEGAQPLRVVPVAVPKTPLRKFTVELPDYVIDAINLRALQTKPKRTARYVILQALRAIDIEVKEPDMVKDGRRSEDV